MDIITRSILVNFTLIIGSADLTASFKWKGVILGLGYLHAHSPAIVHGDIKPVCLRFTTFYTDGQRN